MLTRSKVRLLGRLASGTETTGVLLPDGLNTDCSASNAPLVTVAEALLDVTFEVFDDPPWDIEEASLDDRFLNLMSSCSRSWRSAPCTTEAAFIRANAVAASSLSFFLAL